MKIVPTIMLIGSGMILAGCGSNTANVSQNFVSNIDSFKSQFQSSPEIKQPEATKTLGKYILKVEDKLLETSTNSPETLEMKGNEMPVEILEDSTDNSNLNNNENENHAETLEFDISDNAIVNTETDSNNDNQEADDSSNSDTINNDFSTLYSLSKDIDDNCNEFCELKEKLTKAIIETDNLIEKLNNSSTSLTREQRMFVTEQSNQLKNLGKQLSLATSELNFSLSDLNEMMKSNNVDINDLSVKYYLVLDNLLNGNEMLQNSLSSLSLINQMMRLNQNPIPPNNYGRVLYGFQKNDNPPVVKDYYINENNEMVENNADNSDKTEETDSDNSNVDSYSKTKFKPNLDTYAGNRKNIDSFFNTALLDNDFMYGANGNGFMPYNQFYPMMQGNRGYNPYYGNNAGNTTNMVDDNNQTQNVDNSQTAQPQKERKKFKIKKNIDTYRSDDTPSIKTRIGNIKDKFKASFKLDNDNSDRLQNPIKRLKEKTEN